MKTKIFFAFLATLFFIGTCYFDRTKQSIYAGDSLYYFAHLPAILLYHDVGDYSKTVAAFAKSKAGFEAATPEKLGFSVSPTGAFYIKYPLGVPILVAPFFGLAHVFCLISDQYSADGWSAPYAWAMMISALFYGILGLFLLFLALKRAFPSENLRFAVVAAVGLGTNLFYQLTYNQMMAHQYAFFGFAWLIYLLECGKNSTGFAHFAKMGLACGMIILTRHSDALCLILPLFWGLSRISHFPKRIVDYLKNWRKWLVFGAFSAIPIFFQAIYWKKVSGKWWLDGYQNEVFDFKNPHIVQGIFGFTNGWLIYTPVMIFAVLGLFLLHKFCKNAFWPTIILLPLHFWVIYSWWCWTYINGFGCRAMIDIYPILAFPMAAFFQFFWKNKLPRVLIFSMLTFFTLLNFFQNWQVSKGILWSEEANHAYFWASFGQTKHTKNAQIAFDTNILQPDSANLKLTRILFFDNMETPSGAASFSQKQHFSGQNSVQPTAEYSLERTILIPKNTLDASKTYFLKASVQSFWDWNDPYFWDRNQLARLNLQISEQNSAKKRANSIRISSKINSNGHSIWATGEQGIWGEAAFYAPIRGKIEADLSVLLNIWNPNGQIFYVDDLKLELWEVK